MSVKVVLGSPSGIEFVNKNQNKTRLVYMFELHLSSEIDLLTVNSTDTGVTVTRLINT